jgi:hypothetical protein
MTAGTMLETIAIVIPFMAFAVVLFWAEHQTRAL